MKICTSDKIARRMEGGGGREDDNKVTSGRKATILSRRFSSLPMAYHFHAKGIDGISPDGEVEVRGSHWIFRKPPSIQPLQEDNVVRAGFWDTFFSVAVIAHADIEVTFPKRHLRRSWWIVSGVVLLILAALAIFFLGR